MKKLLMALTVLVGLVGPVAHTTPAQAYTGGGDRCMTKAEWRQIRSLVENADDTYTEGMTRAEVTALVGIPGKLSSRTDEPDGKVGIAVTYRQCLRNGDRADRYSEVWLSYNNWNATTQTLDGVFRVNAKGDWNMPTR